MILTFAQVACDLGLFRKLVDAPMPLSSISLASASEADPILLSRHYDSMGDTPVLTEYNSGRILRFLASMDMIVETGEDEFTSNNVTRTLARPGFQAGIAHT